MLKRVIGLYDKFNLWVLGVLLVCCVVSSCGWYITKGKLSIANEKLNTSGLKLSVSNASIDSLKIELIRVTETLKENERIEQEKQNALAKKLKAIGEKDEPLIDLEKDLNSRKTTLNCAIPEDLKSAWNKL